MRITLLSLTAALVLLAAGCGGSSQSPTERLDAAFENEVTSADIDLDVEATVEGVDELSGPLSFSLSGPYRQDDPEQFPVFDWQVAFEGAGQSFEAGITATEDNAYVEYEGQAYEVGTEVFAQLKAQQEGSGSSFTPQSIKALGVDPTAWLTDAEIEDGEEIGGDATDLVSGDVDVRQVIEDVVKIAQSPIVRRQLESQGQAVPEFEAPTEEELQEVEDSIERLSVEFNIDDDDVLRRTHVEADFTIPEGTDADGLTGGSVTLDFVLEDVGGELEIEPPADPAPISELSEALGGGAPALP